MQATLDAVSLKHVTKALTCLSKYGDELIFQATPERLLFHTRNSSSTAYCRIVYHKQFFTTFRVGNSQDWAGEEVSVDGQLATRALLTILKHRTVEKSVHKCEISIVNGEPGGSADEDHDSLESKLILRLHCKHGVIKTHKLLLSETSRQMAPNVPDSPVLSRLCIGPKAIKDIIEHFPVSKFTKVDLQLIWSFGDDEVQVRSQESSTDPRGSSQLSTELTVGAEEFDTYSIYTSPIVIAFHLKEFNAAIAFAESCNLTLDLRFTDPADPLFIEAEGADLYDTLFIISMSQVTGVTASNNNTSHSRSTRQPTRKRPLEDSRTETASSSGRNTPLLGSGKKRPQKAIVPVEPSKMARATSSIRDSPAGSMPPPPVPASATRQILPSQRYPPHSQGAARQPTPQEEPLFLPSSQLSQADQELIRESGLGIEDMNMDEFNAMMDDDGEEVFDGGAVVGDVGGDRERETSMDIEDTQMAPTQGGSNSSDWGFRPLFDD
ncbi:Rad9-domain-containing protein [Cristinia sonorae]|uniref:Rad9-domain-containing protein n=1 Tax=Cristinia sonorae TaxID=1940300 RepID=A0A8K0UTS7_9AGAR|nr:Rad9-domain-containing protein [Cristinia sonorae]